MSHYYEHKTAIGYDEIAEALAEGDIAGVTQFLRTLATELERHHTPDEDEVIALLPEDIFFGTISKGLVTLLTTAQENVKKATRKAFQQPTHEQIQAQIAELMRRRAEKLAQEAAKAANDANTEAGYEALSPAGYDPLKDINSHRNDFVKERIDKDTETLVNNVQRMNEYNKEDAAKLDELLPDMTATEAEFYKLCDATPIEKISYDGHWLNIMHKDGTKTTKVMGEIEFQATVQFWNRWKTSRKVAQ